MMSNIINPEDLIEHSPPLFRHSKPKGRQINAGTPVDATVLAKIDDLPIGEFRLACFLALEAGMRLNEVLNLEWRDFTIKWGFVFVRHGKGGKYRLVPLTKRLLQELNAYLIDARLKGRRLRFNDRVIHFKRRALQARCERKGFGFHQLRHTFGYRLGMALDVSELAVLMGHSSTNTTQIYRHVNPDWLKRKIEELEQVEEHESSCRFKTLSLAEALEEGRREDG